MIYIVNLFPLLLLVLLVRLLELVSTKGGVCSLSVVVTTVDRQTKKSPNCSVKPVRIPFRPFFPKALHIANQTLLNDVTACLVNDIIKDLLK